jgi:hypothetical protein
MRISAMFAPDLHHWLAHSGRQRRTQQRIDGFAAAWNRGPHHQRFDAALAALPEQSAAAVAAAVRGLFADEAWVDGLLAGLAAELGDDPFFEPPFRSINSDVHQGLIIFEDPRVSIAAGVTGIAALAARKSAPRGATSIGFTGRVSVLKFVKAGGASLGFWEAPPIDAGFSAAAAGRCWKTGSEAIPDGHILLLDGRRRSYVIERARSNLLILQAEINLEQAPVGVEYDAATGAYVGCSANGDGASRIQMITTLLRKLDRGDAFPAIAAFLDHADFFVRWHVMRELLGLDAAAALPHLRRMAARDPHDDVRRAARGLLDRLEAAPRPRKAA